MRSFRDVSKAVRACVRVALVVLSALVFLGWSASQAHAAAKRKPSVLIVHAEPTPNWPEDVQAKLNSSGLFSSVALYSPHSTTPPLATLLAYDAVLLFTDGGFANTTTLGNTLADYVDAGGGVVNMAFSVGLVSPPLGRWNPGYLCMAAGGGGIQNPQSLDLSSITNQNHPILIGVGSFDGGSSSYRADQNNVVAGSTVVARWTGGNVLVAAGPLPGRADLNYFPVSSSARPDFWNISTDGTKLMANALLSVMRPRVLIAGSPAVATWNDDVKAKVRATGLIGVTDIVNIGLATPTLAQLQLYDAVLVYSDDLPSNTTALGNVFADYVDAGGGVVKAAVATAFDDLGGRWVGTYDLIAISNSLAGGTATLGAITYPSHPALAGVASFNGGTSSFRCNSSALRPGAFTIAQWSDGRPLVVASTKFSNRVDLNFYPPSSTVSANHWSTATDGAKLMANALVYVCKPYVACVAAEEVTLSADSVAKLLASRRFSGVANITAHTSTPNAATLKPFNAVLCWSDFPFADTTTFGNNLADFVDAGASVVTAVFANVNVAGSPNYSIGGRWLTQGYEIVPSPLPFVTTSGPQAFLGAALEPANPINAFVRKFDGGTRSFRASSNPLLRGREVLRWSDGRMLASVHNFKKRVDLGMFPPSSATSLTTQVWNQRTDGTWLMANALEYAVYKKPCPGDFNGDGAVDDSDFVLFASYYDTLIDPRGDLTGDGQTEDSDFVSFAGAYDTLTCP